MSTNTYKERIYQEFSRVALALAHPKRLELMDLLSQRAFGVEELSREIGMSIASTSQHLQVLKSARIVSTRRQGNFIYYSIADESILRLLAGVKEVAHRQFAEIDRILHDFKQEKELLDCLTLDAFLQKSRSEEVVLLDVRPADEFAAGHIPGAISMPVAELPSRLAELPRDSSIVAYCRGPLCVMAADAVKILRENAFQAQRMEEGVVEWKMSLPENHNN